MLLLKGLFSRIWIELSNQKLKLEERTLAKLMSQTLGTLVVLNRIFFDAAWEALTDQMKLSSEKGEKVAARLVSILLKALIEGSSNSNVPAENKEYLKEKAIELLRAISRDEMEKIESFVGSNEEKLPNFEMIEEILEQFREWLFMDQDLAAVREIYYVTESVSHGGLAEMGWLAFQTCL